MLSVAVVEKKPDIKFDESEVDYLQSILDENTERHHDNLKDYQLDAMLQKETASIFKDSKVQS